MRYFPSHFLIPISLVMNHTDFYQTFQSCKDDIKMFCKSTLEGIKKGTIEDGRGAVISCLKNNFDKISVECEDSMTTILEQEVVDYKLDPVLSRFCADDIEVSCPDVPDDQVKF